MHSFCPAAASGITEEEFTVSTFKTKGAAKAAALATLGPEAVEGFDYTIKGANSGWAWEHVPPANDGANLAQVARLGQPGTQQGDRALSAIGGDQAVVERPKTAPAGDGAKPPRKPPAPPSSEPRKSKARASKKAAKPSAPEGKSKTDMLLDMLKKPGGATSAEMEKATGWKPHSVRGLLGTLRAKGVNIVSKKLPKEPTIYRIAAGSPAPKAAAEQVGDVI